MKRIISTMALLVLMLAAISCTPRQEIKTDQPSTEKVKLPSLARTPAKPDIKPHMEPVRLSQEKDEKYIILNFDNTDIKTIITSFGELLNINYIVSPGISGNVTIQSYRRIPVSQLFPVFQSILELNGLTAIKEGLFYKIIPIDSAKNSNLGIEGGKEVKYTLDPTFVTQLVPLEYVKASDVANVLKGFLPRGADIVVYEPTNMLIITALPQSITRFMKIIEAIDVNDTATESTKTYVYDVVHGEAKKLAEILKTVLTNDKAATPSTQPVRALRPPTAPQTPATATRTTRAPITTPTASTTSTGSQIASVSADGITITAYEDINALIVKCSPKDYIALLDILRRLDIPPKQVLIEVLIAELTLEDTLQFGLEWLIKNGQGEIFGTPGASFSDRTVPITSSTYTSILSGVIDDAAFNAVLSMVETTSKANVIASPIILAMDNKEAEITIGTSQPTATGLNQSTAAADTNSTTLVSTGQIEYRDVGTILKVTPRITERGNVTLDIYVESSSVASSATVGSGSFPAFNKRNAKTNAVVGDGHTLFIGGIIDNQLNQNSTGIPYLSKIPYIGPMFFSYAKDDKKKTELIVMITPHVVKDQQGADDLTDQYKNKIKVIEKSFIDIDTKLGKQPEKKEPEKKAAAVEPEAKQPELKQSEPVKIEVKPEPAKPEPTPVKPEPAKVEPVPVKPEPVKTEPVPVKPEPTKAEPLKPEAKPEAIKPEQAPVAPAAK